jgi:acetyltransferase-like isoleucine patch superfamily enzyme
MVQIFRRLLGKLRAVGAKQLAIIGRNTEITGVIDMRSERSQVIIGNDCLIEGTLVTETDESNIIINNNVYIGGTTILDCVKSITIEDDVLISYQCILFDSDNHSLKSSIRQKDLADWKQKKHDWTTTKSLPIRISRGAWLGARVIVTKGVTVGEGAIVAAGSVVTKDVPPWTIVAGNPARIVRELGLDER